MTDSRQDEDESPLAKAIGGLAMRSIGPAFMGGRIADIVVHPKRRSTWYVAAGSGGVWKTVNAGTTWSPVFDDQVSFSIGCLALDPTNPDVVWVGTGESVSGRHVAWGDGVYRSDNGGRNWQHLGLERSEHIGTIVIDPRDTNTVYVAAEGPLWCSGGQRGVYKTTDGGASWEPVLEIDDDTGVTSLVIAPDNPEVLYAAAYQRRRHVAAFVGGGPGSGIHKSDDGGKTWRQLSEGLPEDDMGKIGLAVTPADPDLVYATIEANEEQRGFYRSTDRGESWERRNEYISGGTGPHYYQEIFASPTDRDRVYQVDVFLHETGDGGATFRNLETANNKHSDNHAVWIDPDDPEHLLIGTDAGLYESFDGADTNRHFANLPLAQFYRVAVDNAVPFYNVMAGAQDLGTLYGPSRTTNIDGVRNQDWSVPLGADGYHVAFDPTDPDICYLEWQVGNVMRQNRRTMELQDIQPQAGPDDPPERWNWDCPIVISPHDPRRIYVASQRVWRSDDRGDSWTAVSGDLTTGRNRYEMPTFGSVPSVESLYDNEAMSQFSTITHLSESPLVEGVLYVGTDDGLVQISEDGGASWRSATGIPGLPGEAFINNVEASLHDSEMVFVAADDHKHGDFAPYLFTSSDRGRTWRSIRGDLPDGTVVWVIEQDHVNPELLFVGTEFGVYVSLNSGEHWHKLTKDVPLISFRDLKLHRRDNDLVAASFGRGIFILDDYSPLRTMSSDQLALDATLFPVRDTWWYVPHRAAQAPGQPTLGSTAFRTPNPAFGATFTYHLTDDIVGLKKRRVRDEKPRREAGEDVTFPGVDRLWQEHLDTDPLLALVVRDADSQPVRRLEAESEAGLHRTTWDLRRVAPDPISLEDPEFKPPWAQDPLGPLVEPGRYTVELAVLSADGNKTLSERQEFTVKPTPPIASRGGDENMSAEFRAATSDLARQVAGTVKYLEATRARLPQIRTTITRTASDDPSLMSRLDGIHRTLEEIYRELVADPVAERLAEAALPSITQQVGRVSQFHWRTTMQPTGTQVESLARADAGHTALNERLARARAELDQLVNDIDAAGGTWTSRE